jgi:hypothetical protein
MAGINPQDFGDEMVGHAVTENWRDSGYDHHTVHGSGNHPSTVSWNEVEYYDSNGVYHREVVDVHVYEKRG